MRIDGKNGRCYNENKQKSAEVGERMLFTAHSGANKTKPNALGYFEAMKRVNADVLEVDVRNVRGKLLLTHDRPHFWQRKNLLPLSYAFEFIKKYDFLLNCDLKKDGIVPDLMDLAEKCGVQDRIIITGSAGTEPDRKAIRFGDWYVNPTAGDLASLKDDQDVHLSLKPVEVLHDIAKPETLTTLGEGSVTVKVKDREQEDDSKVVARAGETVEIHVAKGEGRKLYTVGYSWTDKNGEKRYNTEIVADNVYFGDSKREANGGSSNEPPVPTDVPEGFVPNFNEAEDGELPF